LRKKNGRKGRMMPKFDVYLGGKEKREGGEPYGESARRGDCSTKRKRKGRGGGDATLRAINLKERRPISALD